MISNISFAFLFTGVAEHPLLPDLDIFNLSKSKDNSMETNTGEMAATETAVVDDNAPLFYSPGKRGNYFSFKKWHFVSKIVQTYCEKKIIYLVIEKNDFEITQTIYSNSERSVQFLKNNSFSTCSLRFLRSNTLEQLKQSQNKKSQKIVSAFFTAGS